MGFGYPLERDAYIGLLLLDRAARGQGLGLKMLAALERRARAQRATRLLVAVLRANPSGLAFWCREGFVRDAHDGSPVHLRLTRDILPVSRNDAASVQV
jgi:GNAT superfamily N-acetyltransferase